MSYSGNRDFGRQATAMLATTVVVLLGLGVCTFIAAFLADDPKFPFLVCGGMVVLVILLSRILAPRRPKTLSEMGGTLSSEAGSKWDDFDVDRVKARRPKVKSFGTNEPPTPEKIRELADGPNNWVPQGAGYQESAVPKDPKPRRDADPHYNPPAAGDSAILPLKAPVKPKRDSDR
ncbi:MAG: hypothetical protein ACKVT0_02130 [Planctomycetaceae bacterium]